MENVQVAPVGADEDHTSGGVAGQGLAAGEVAAVIEQAENDTEFALVLGMYVEAGGD
ncbi:hypothetical protein AB0L85_32765 [Streptomyces sp. NPDC052051]|uniref:hypothetical protein n=1 Tax=Streptomyces sp. NPDC052051 TaxID=3154649 RepID=UPI00342FAA33